MLSDNLVQAVYNTLQGGRVLSDSLVQAVYNTLQGGRVLSDSLVQAVYNTLQGGRVLFGLQVQAVYLTRPSRAAVCYLTTWYKPCTLLRIIMSMYNYVYDDHARIQVNLSHNS